jgi:hypothetical protein
MNAKPLVRIRLNQNQKMKSKNGEVACMTQNSPLVRLFPR